MKTRKGMFFSAVLPVVVFVFYLSWYCTAANAEYTENILFYRISSFDINKSV